MIWLDAPQKAKNLSGEWRVFFHPLMLSDPQPYLGRRLQAVLQVFARWIISEEGKPRQLRLPHANPLVQCVEELFNCGGAIETYHLQHMRKQRTRSDDIQLQKHNTVASEPAVLSL